MEKRMRLSDAANEVIRLAEASRRYWERELPKRHPHYPLVRPGEDSGPPSPEDEQLIALLKGLPQEQVYALILLMYIGRGDYAADYLGESYQAMRDTFLKPEYAIAQMADMPTLAEDMSDGLGELKKRHIDVDTFPFEPAAGNSHS
jgi:hypothetical protein